MGGGRRYCVLCSHYQGQVTENNEKITLHRIPAGSSESDKKRRESWVQRIRFIRPNAPISDNTRICNLHFDNNICTKSSVPTKLNLKYAKPETQRRPLVRISPVNKTLPPIKEDENHDPDTQHEQISANTSRSNSSCEAQIQVGSSDVKLTCTAEIQAQFPLMKPEDIFQNDDKTRFYTGFPNYKTFKLMFDVLMKHGGDRLTYWEGELRSIDGDNRKYNDPNFFKPGRKRKLRPIDEFYMVCLRLRLGMLQEHLADMFFVSVMTVSRILNTWLNFMYDHYKGMIPWPTREQILANLPKAFVEMQTVRIVIDATEFFCEKPGNLTAQYLTWSEYKHHNTFKVLIGVAPNGLVTFVSRVWGGHTSDRHIVQKDGDLLLPHLQSDDIILADKGFTIADLLPCDIGLNMPPFVSSSKQMTADEFFKTQQIAQPRIVVEMKMEQIKNFKILQTILPLSEAHLAEQIILICTAMTNLYEPLLR
ncbi:uncharacterized protein LOC134277743 [Saccostrea cucullata]|uniref:uncharacterized protein LOC134262813 n=1 Tax=Saccostrea cuccullata TaxID=36930 RepID=UPI002ED00A07